MKRCARRGDYTANRSFKATMGFWVESIYSIFTNVPNDLSFHSIIGSAPRFILSVVQILLDSIKKVNEISTASYPEPLHPHRCLFNNSREFHTQRTNVNCCSFLRQTSRRRPRARPQRTAAHRFDALRLYPGRLLVAYAGLNRVGISIASEHVLSAHDLQIRESDYVVTLSRCHI